MEYEENELGQPVGKKLSSWQIPSKPEQKKLSGVFCTVEALNVETHAHDLFEANSHDAKGANWTYLPYGPFLSESAYREWLESIVNSADPLFYAICNKTTGKAVGLASYLRITPESGSIEVGHLNFSPLMQRSSMATEAMYLMMKNAFELGYRRYEWKCNALNAPSCEAAKRLGFHFEGIFRQSTVVKGRNRDTAWYSILDTEWPEIEASFLSWLSPSNFDASGNQRTSLAQIRGRPHSPNDN